MVDFSSGPLKDWTPPIISGLFLLIAGIIAVLNKRGAEFRGRDFERERAEKTNAEKARESELADGVTQAQDLTARFRTLMEGYENRIKDLTSELAIRKMEHDRLETVYEARLNLCNVCPTYHEHLRNQNARPAS